MTRSEAIEVAKNLKEFYDGKMGEFLKFVEKELTQTERRGEWIKMSDADGVYWACSECGEDIPRVAHFNRDFDLLPHLESINKTNYCPNCGVKMGQRRADDD